MSRLPSNCFVNASNEVRQVLKQAVDSAQSIPEREMMDAIRGSIVVSKDISSKTRGNPPKLPFVMSAKGRGKRAVEGQVKDATDWWDGLAKALTNQTLDWSDEAVNRVFAFGMANTQGKGKEGLRQALLKIDAPTLEDLEKAASKFPFEYRQSIVNLALGGLASWSNWLKRNGDIFADNAEIMDNINRFLSRSRRLLQELNEIPPIHPEFDIASIERKLSEKLSRISHKALSGEDISSHRAELDDIIKELLAITPQEALDPTSPAHLQKKLRQALYLRYGRENLDMPKLYDALRGVLKPEDLEGTTLEAFENIRGVQYAKPEDPPIVVSSPTPAEMSKAAKKVERRAKRKIKENKRKKLVEEQLSLFSEAPTTAEKAEPPAEAASYVPPEFREPAKPAPQVQPAPVAKVKPEPKTDEELHRRLAEDLLRSAYGQEEVNQAAEFLRSRGVDIPVGATKEEALDALGRHFEENKPLKLDRDVKLEPKRVRTPSDPVSPPEPPPPPAENRLALPAPSDPPLLSPEPFDKLVGEAVGGMIVDSVAWGEAANDVLGFMANRAVHSRMSVREAEVIVNKTVQPINESPSRDLIYSRIANHPAFEVAEEEEGVVVKIKRDYLKAERERLLRQNPYLLLLKEEHLDGYVAWRTVWEIAANGDEELMGMFDAIFASRMLMNPAVEHLEETTLVLAAHFGQHEVFDLILKANPSLLTRTEDWLVKATQYSMYHELIEQILQRNGVLRLATTEDGWISAEEWHSMSIEEQEAAIDLIRTNEEIQESFLDNFGFVKEGRELLKASLQDGNIRPGVEKGAFIANPAVLQKVLDTASRYGVDPMTLLTAGKIVYEHALQLQALLDGVGLRWDDLPVLTPRGLGVDAIRSMMEALKQVYKAKGKRGEDVYNLLEDLLHRTGQTELLGAEAFKALFFGVSQHLEKAFGEAWTLAVNYVFVADRLFHRGLMTNLGEIAAPLIAHLSKLRTVQLEDGSEYAYRLLPEIFSLTPNEAAPVGLGAMLETVFGQDKRRFFEAIMPYMPEEWQTLYYAYKAAGEEGHFEIYVPKMVADLMELDDFATRHLLTTINDGFKSMLVVYNPLAQLRNLFSNMMLMGHINERGIWYNFRLFRQALSEMRSNNLFYQQVKALDPSLDLTLVHEMPKGAEVLYLTYTMPNTFFRKMANLPLLRTLHRMMGDAEAAAKYAALRSFLELKYGAEWASKYTVEDLLEGLTRINEFLVDYRTVPPAIQYLRNGLGLFPFITFAYTIASSFVRNPAALATEAVRTVRIRERFKKLHEGAGLDALPASEALLLDYQKNNPLLLSFLTEDGRMITYDLTFILPIGVFEPGFHFYTQPTLGTGFLGMLGSLKNQAGSVVRPFLELAANRNFLTGAPIWNEYDPPSVKAAKGTAHISSLVPLIRMAISAGEELGFAPIELIKTPAKTKAPVLEGDGAIHAFGDYMLKVMGYRGFAFHRLQVQEYQRVINEYKDTVSEMRRLIQHPTMTTEQKTELFKRYAERLQELEQKAAEANRALIAVPAYEGSWEPLNHEAFSPEFYEEEAPSVPQFDYEPPVFEPYGYTPNPNEEIIDLSEEGW